MSLSTRRATFGALAAPAAAALVVLAGAAPPAVAGPATAASYAGSTAADGVSVALDLPQPAGPLPAHVVVGLISAHGALGHDGIRHAQPDAASALAALATGPLTDGGGPLAPLDRSATADRHHPDATTALAAMPANPLASGRLAPLAAHVRGLHASGSDADLVSGRVARFADLLPAALRQQVDQALQQATSQAQQAVEAAQSALAPVLGPVVQQDPTGTAATLQQQLQHLDDSLPTMVGAVENSAVLTIDGLHATQSLRRSGRTLASSARVRLASLDLLGGLVKVTGFASDATAAATGVAGEASSTAKSTVASVQVGDGLLGVSLTDRGTLTGDVAGLLPADVVKQVNAALDQVTGAINTILAQAGVSVVPAATSHHAAADGGSADASGTGLLVTVQPPGQPHPLLQVGIGAVRARVAARATRVLDERVELPHTGSGIGTGALVGASAALVGGLWLRRRLAGS